LKKHPCKDCKYKYFVNVKIEKTLYNAITDKYTSFYPEESKPACGYSPGGTIVDEEAPLCASYEKEVK